MKKSSAETVNLAKNIAILDFDAKYADEILEIQTECGLSVWSKNDYTSELEREDSIFKIAQTVDEKIVGFALVRLLIGNSNDADVAFDSSEILNIAVRRSSQKNGVGQMIFDEILKELDGKNISEIWLEVRQSNSNAISFYQKNKFKVQFERKNYYTNPNENAYVLRRLLKSNETH